MGVFLSAQIHFKKTKKTAPARGDANPAEPRCCTGPASQRTELHSYTRTTWQRITLEHLRRHGRRQGLARGLKRMRSLTERCVHCPQQHLCRRSCSSTFAKARLLSRGSVVVLFSLGQRQRCFHAGRSTCTQEFPPSCPDHGTCCFMWKARMNYLLVSASTVVRCSFWSSSGRTWRGGRRIVIPVPRDVGIGVDALAFRRCAAGFSYSPFAQGHLSRRRDSKY